MKFLFLFGITILASGWELSSAQATLQANLQEKTFAAESGKCSLKRFSLLTYDGESAPEADATGRYYETSEATVFETTDASCVAQYGVVQFIKGCLYETDFESKTGHSSQFMTSRDLSRGVESVPFVYPRWAVNSPVKNALFNSDGNSSAAPLKNYSFQSTPMTIENNQRALLSLYDRLFSNHQQSYENGQSAATQVYVTHVPTSASYYYSDGISQISTAALRFKTCIYRLNDIPSDGTDPASFDTPSEKGGPIQCFDSADSVRFNAKTKAFEKTSGDDPFCTMANAASAN